MDAEYRSVPMKKLTYMSIAPLALCAAAPAPQSVGPAPDRAAGIALVESAIRSTLKDPDSAQFTWPNGFVAGWYHRLFGKKYEGWITCGTVNAKNGYGGYAGRAAAIGVIRDGVVIEANMDDASAQYGTFVAEACKKIGIPAL
jgi:hypothetical protein